MAILVTNSVQIARFANALYGIKLGSNTYAGVVEDVKALGLASTVNAYYNYSFGSKTTSEVADIILANVGLTGDTAAHNLVVGKLNAAGTAKGAAILDMLNDFANLTSDATYGAAATAWNANVAAAQAYTAANSEDVATSATTSKTFTLTTSTDAGVDFTGGAGNDTFNLTAMANSNVLDSIDGGAGTDTLAITVTGDVTALKGTIKGIDNVTATASTGNIGTVETAPAVAVAQVKTFTLEDKVSGTAATYANGDLITVTLGDKSKSVTLAAGDDTATEHAVKIAAAIDSLMDAAYGASTYASSSGAVVSVTSGTAGVALPTITVTGTKSDATAIDYKFTADKASSGFVANVEASSYVAKSTFAVPSTVLTATLAADKQINASAAATTDITATAATTATLTGGKNVTVTSTGGATVKSAAGAVAITEKGTTGSAVVVEGGTTVSVTKYGAASTGGTAYSGNITVGADASFGATSVSSDGYPQIDANVAKQPTGNVTINNSRAYTDDYGQAQKVYGSGTATVYTNGATNVSVATAGAITVKDVQVATRAATAVSTAVKGTMTLTSATIDGSNAAASVTSDVLTSLKVINTGASSVVTVTNATAAGHALTLTLGNNTSGTEVVDATATSVTIGTESQSTSTAANASKANVNLTTAVATSLTFNNSNPVALTGTGSLDGATKVTSVTLTGSAKVELGAISDATKLKTIDASAATGAVTVTLPATGNYGMTLTGGSGKDVVTLADTIASGTYLGSIVTTTINLGAGNDSVLKGTSGAIGTGAVVNGGDGDDTIAATLLNAGNTAAITGFEILGLDSTSTYDSDLLVGATGLAALVVGGTYTNVNTNQGISYGTSLSAGSITLQFGTAEATATTDSYAITLNKTAASSATEASPDSLLAKTLTIDTIENVTVNSTGSGFIANTINLVDSKARTVTLTGDKDLTITFDDSSAGTFGTAGISSTTDGVSLIDGSAATGKLNINTTDVGVAYAGLTVKGGSAADTITLAQEATVDAGAGADTITAAVGTRSTITTGAGKDTVYLAGVIYDTSAFVTTVTDLAVGDKLDFLSTSSGGTAVAVGTKAAMTGVTTFADALTAAANTGGSSGAEVNWFQYGGNTYVVFDASASTTAGFNAAADVVVKLTGLVDLATATFNSTTGLLTVA